MQIGYNNDVEYRGKTFHIQTEDHGMDSAQIESQIFHAGAICDTSILDYSDMLEEVDDTDERIGRVRQMMQANHKSLYKKLRAGEYDEFAGLEPVEDEEDIAAPSPEEFSPGQDRVPQQALAVEEGDSEAIAEMQDVEHVDLGSLQDKLEDVGELDDSEADDVGAPTMVTTPEEIQAAMNADAKRREEQKATQKVSAAPKPAARKKEKPATSPDVSGGLPNFELTGATAWRGCEEADEDLSLTALVEAFVAG